MKKILVSGIINIETSLKVDSFQLNDIKVVYPFFGISSRVSGSGMNIAKAISTLGAKPLLFSLVGKDNSTGTVYEEMHKYNISTKYINETLNETPQSVIIYDNEGNSQKHVDLKDIQEKDYTTSEIKSIIKTCGISALCNINFSRSFLKIAKEYTLIATDVHALSSIDDEYNKEFMEYADILFLSRENLSVNPYDFVKELSVKFKAKIIIIGMGKEGAILYYRNDNFINLFPAVTTRPVVNVAGAGDALFASFLFFYNKTLDPYLSLNNAIIFASYKIGTNSPADGFLTEKDLSVLPYTILK